MPIYFQILKNFDESELFNQILNVLKTNKNKTTLNKRVKTTQILSVALYILYIISRDAANISFRANIINNYNTIEKNLESIIQNIPRFNVNKKERRKQWTQPQLRALQDNSEAIFIHFYKLYVSVFLTLHKKKTNKENLNDTLLLEKLYKIILLELDNEIGLRVLYKQLSTTYYPGVIFKLLLAFLQKLTKAYYNETLFSLRHFELLELLKLHKFEDVIIKLADIATKLKYCQNKIYYNDQIICTPKPMKYYMKLRQWIKHHAYYKCYEPLSLIITTIVAENNDVYTIQLINNVLPKQVFDIVAVNNKYLIGSTWPFRLHTYGKIVADLTHLEVIQVHDIDKFKLEYNTLAESTDRIMYYYIKTASLGNGTFFYTICDSKRRIVLPSIKHKRLSSNVLQLCTSSTTLKDLNLKHLDIDCAPAEKKIKLHISKDTLEHNENLLRGLFLNDDSDDNLSDISYNEHENDDTSTIITDNNTILSDDYKMNNTSDI